MGTPYEDQDCWDIVKQFYSRVFGIDLAKWDELRGNPRDNAANMDTRKRELLKVGLPRLGDIALIKMFGHNSHVGVYLGDGKFLHSIEESGCVIDRISNWKPRIEGYYRWPE